MLIFHKQTWTVNAKCCAQPFRFSFCYYFPCCKTWNTSMLLLICHKIYKTTIRVTSSLSLPTLKSLETPRRQSSCWDYPQQHPRRQDPFYITGIQRFAENSAFFETPLPTEWNLSNRGFWVPSYPSNPTSYSVPQVFLSTTLNPCHTLQLPPLPSVGSCLCLESL